MRRWTPTEDALARELVADGYTQEDVGAELGRSRDSVKWRLSKLKVRVGRGGRPDPDLAAELMALLSIGLSCYAIARRTGRHESDVCKVVRRLEAEGLVRRTGDRGSTRWHVTRAWTEDRDGDVAAEAKELARGGAGAEEIARRLGCDPRTVRGWLRGAGHEGD